MAPRTSLGSILGTASALGFIPPTAILMALAVLTWAAAIAVREARRA